MRNFVLSLARQLPPKFVSDRLLPWVTLAFAMIAGGFGLYQYKANNDAQRVVQTLELYHAYVGELTDKKSLNDLLNTYNDKLGPIIDVTRCQFYLDLIAKGDLQIEDQLDCGKTGYIEILNRSPLNNVQRKTLRQKIGGAGLDAFENGMIFDGASKGYVFKIMSYFTEVVVCVNQGACDEAATIDFFADDMVSFLNGFCSIFEQEAKTWNSESLDQRIVHFLIRNDQDAKIDLSRDPDREKLFRCERHRRIEAQGFLARFLHYRLGIQQNLLPLNSHLTIQMYN